MIRRKVLAGLAMLLALGGGGVAFAVSTEDSTEPQIRTFAAGAARDTPQSEAQLSERGFSVWRRAARATDVPDTDVLGVEAIERGANAGRSRRLSNTYGTAIYATPVNGGICLSSEDYVVSTCRPTAITSRTSGSNPLYDLVATSCSPYLPSDKIAIYGLVPDKVTRVRLNRGKGASVTAPVKDNFLIVIADRSGPPITSLTWSDAAGATFTVPSPMPQDASADNCAETDPAAAVREAKAATKEAAVTQR